MLNLAEDRQACGTFLPLQTAILGYSVAIVMYAFYFSLHDWTVNFLNSRK